MVRHDPQGDHRIAVIFNGVIYNHRDLRRELTAQGEHFESDHSDTEVIVQGWRRWNTRVFDRLDGMYAIAIWDSSLADVILARDRWGEKPLYYAFGALNGATCFAFASTASAVRAAANEFQIPPAGDQPRPLSHWIRFGFGPLPLDGRVHEFPPGCSASLVSGIAARASLSPTRTTCTLHREPPPQRTQPLTPDTADLLLRRAVESRLESDVPLGCFLSGGIDSSLLAAMSHRALGRLNTFTVQMPDPRFDESHHARAVADHLGVRHATLPCEARPADDLVRLITQLGLPFGDSSLLPTYWVSRAARAHVTVALSGDGGDEFFAGYDRYKAAAWVDAVPEPLRFAPRALASAVPPGPDPKARRSRLSRFLNAAGRDGYPDLLSIFPAEQLAALLSPAHLPHFSELSGQAAIARAIAFDTDQYLPGDLLRKSDTASMSVALEVRCPFLDPALTSAALAAPIAALMPDRKPKGLLRQVAYRYLPAGLLDRPKQGFAIPIGDWFRSDFGGMKTLLLDLLSSADPFPASRLGAELNRARIDTLVHEHMHSLRDHSQRLYMLTVLAIWARYSFA